MQAAPDIFGVRKEQAEITQPVFPSISEVDGKVREETLVILEKAKVVSPQEREGFSGYLVERSIPCSQIMPMMAELRGISDGDQSGALAGWARVMTPVLKKRYPFVPFADKVAGSSLAIFDKHPKLYEFVAELQCPLVFAEDADAIGIGSVNPVAATFVADEIVNYFVSLGEPRPFISIFLMEMRSWQAACSKQLRR